MRKIITVLMLFITPFAFSQNFQVIPTEGRYYFDNDSYPKSYEFIDSKEVEGGNMHYPYKSGLRHMTEDGWISNPNTSFIGDSVFVSHLGDITIYNDNGFPLFFKHFDNLEPWTVLMEENGAKIQGQYDWFEEGEILPGLIGYFTFLRIQVFDSLGNTFNNHPLHNIELKISANYGAISLFLVNSFKGIYYDDYGINDFSLYHLSSFIKSDELYGFSPDFIDLFTSLDVGIETHITWGDYSYDYEVKQLLVDKIVNDPYITYVYKNCVHQFSTSTDTIFSEDIYKTFNYRMRLNEIFDSVDATGQSGFLYALQYSLGDEQSSFKPYYTYVKYYKDSEFEWDQTFYWSIKADINYSMGTNAHHKFIEGLGDFIPYRGESGTHEELVYYKTPYDEWGTPLEFSCPNTGISETQIAQITIFPNPAEDVIYLKSPLKTDRVNMFDLQGRLVKQFELRSQKSLDVSELESGVYLIEILSGNKLISHQKIMKL